MTTRCLSIHSRGLTLAAAGGLALLTTPAAADEILMPLRGDTFDAAQTFFRTSGHAGYDCDPSTPASQRSCALDISAMRWNAVTSSWTSARPTPSGHPNPLSNTLMWHAPIYSPVDGEIVSCWRSMPDDDADGDDIRCPGGNEDEAGGHACARRGNNVTIRTSDDRLLTFAHLGEDTIPASLCPFTDQFIYTDDSVTCGFYDDMRLDTPISVHKGDFVGRVGTSGAGVGAHLHVGMSEARTNQAGLVCVGDSLPMEFSEAWYQPRVGAPATANGWVRLQSDRLPVGIGDMLLWPDPIGPRVDTVQVEPGAAPALAMTNAGGVVSYRTSSGNLASVAFDFDGAGAFDLGALEEEGPVDDVDVAKIGAGSRHVVVAVENGAGNLQLLPYYVTTGEDLIRGNGVTAGTASRLAITRSPAHQGVVTATRNGSNTLTVAAYSTVVDGTDITVTPEGSATSNASIRRIAIDFIEHGRGLDESSGAFTGVVTAERRSDDRLVVRTWSVSPGGSVALVDSWLATWGGAPLLVEQVAVSVVGNGNRELALVSAREASSDTLRELSLEVDSSGNLDIIERHSAGEVGPIASDRAGNADVVTAVRSSSDDLLGISWSVRPNFSGSGGGAIRRTGTRVAGTVGALDVGVRGALHDAVFAVEDGSGEIRLLHYLTNYSVTQ